MSPTAWLGVAAVASAGCLLWVSHELRRQPVPRILVFVVLAVFFRLMLSAFHPVTVPAIVGPFSINALYSLFIIAVGFLLIDRRLLRLRFLLPVHVLIGLTLLGALYNGTLGDSIQSLLKWLFFIVIVLATYESVIRAGRAVVLEKLLLSFSIPVVLQLLSIVLRHSKATENDGSVSYVGGYYHEAVFSGILISALMIAALRQMCRPRTERWWAFVPLLLAVEVALTNYRTNILTMLVPLLGYLYFRFVRNGMPLAKVATMMVGMVGLLLLASLDVRAVIDRFAEIGTVFDSMGELIKAPIYYTDLEQDYFSARVYLWSQYVDAYLDSSFVQHLIGLGADSWEHHFHRYAHNTFVSYLYELGIIGCGALIYFFLGNMARCFSGTLTTYSAMLFLCFFGFLVMNLGTMPLWQVEGMSLFAILCALAWELKLAVVVATREGDPRAPVTLDVYSQNLTQQTAPQGGLI